jgi:hypothetical protein
MQLPPPERIDRRNPYLKPPLHTNVLIAANNEPTITFTTIVRERPQTMETPFDFDTPKIYEPNTIPSTLTNINNQTKKTSLRKKLKLLQKRNVLSLVHTHTHPFLKINEKGEFNKYLTEVKNFTPINFNFLSDGRYIYTQDTVNNSKEVQTHIFNNWLLMFYKEIYKTFDFSKCISFISQDKSINYSYNNSNQNKKKWNLTPDGQNALYFFLKEKILTKKS